MNDNNSENPESDTGKPDDLYGEVVFRVTRRALIEEGEKWPPKFGPVAKLDFSGSAGHERTAEL
jgi:hypothetical protein